MRSDRRMTPVAVLDEGVIEIESLVYERSKRRIAEAQADKALVQAARAMALAARAVEADRPAA